MTSEQADALQGVANDLSYEVLVATRKASKALQAQLRQAGDDGEIGDTADFMLVTSLMVPLFSRLVSIEKHGPLRDLSEVYGAWRLRQEAIACRLNQLAGT